MFLYMKTNILRGLGIFKIDFPVVTNQLVCRVTMGHLRVTVGHSWVTSNYRSP